MPVEPIAPEDDFSRTYAQRITETEQQSVIERARKKAQQTQPDIEVGPVGRIEEGVESDPETTARVAADIGRGVIEIPRAAMVGAVDAATEFAETIGEISDPLAGFLESNLPLGEAPTPEELFENIRPADPKSNTGKALSGIFQFVTGFIPALRVTKALKVDKAGKLVEGAVAGSLADVAVIDEAETRLSNLIQEVPALQNPVTEYLASDPDDSKAEAKLKQAIEGLGIGAAAEGFVASLRMLSKAKKAPTVADEDIAKAEVSEPEVAPVLGDPEAPLFKVSDEIKAKADEFLKGPPEVDVPPIGTPRSVAGETDLLVGNINMARIGGPEDVREVIAQTAKLFEDRITTTTQTNDQTIALANEIAVDPKRMTQTLTKDGAFTAAEITSLRFLLQQSGQELQTLAKKVAGVSATEADKFAFERHMAFHATLLGQASKGAREAGRALQAFKITAEGGSEQAKAIKELLAQSGIDSAKKAQMIGSLDTPQGLNTFVRQSLRAKTADVFLEAWINGLLSGPQTHAVNTLSNMMVATWTVPEHTLARGIRTLTGGDGVVQGEATARAFGLVQSTWDALRLAGRALRTGEASDQFTKIEARQQRAISAKNFNLDESSLFGRGVDLLGEVVRTPGRFLTAEDEFFKAIGYRMELQTRAFRQATQEGLEGSDKASRIQELINNPPEDLRMASIDAARYQTFTKPLGHRGARFQSVVNATPPLKLIMPFIRTPLNIMKFVGERSPLAPLAPSIQAEIAAGGVRRDLALSRMALGSMVMALSADLASTGVITGGGPTDSRIRSAMRRTGWAPYSVKVGDTYYSYSRTDPVGMTLGIAADLSEILGQLDAADAEKAAAASIMAVSQNIVSKTYMSGIADIMEVFAAVSPELGASVGERYVQRLAGSLIPAGVAQVARVEDPTLRQVESIVEQFRSRIPGYSKDLPPRLNMWGAPIRLNGGLGPDIVSPIWQSPVLDSPADEEIVRNQIPLAMPTKSIQGVELGPWEYNRYVELAGNELKDPATGLGARETLEAIIKGDHSLSAQYERASDGPEGGKAIIVRSVVQSFRAAARDQVIQEFPDLRDTIRKRKESALQ